MMTSGDHSAHWTETFVEATGTRLAVRDYGGTGRALVFVHGGPGGNLGQWDGFPERLSDRFHPLAYDQRGHGQSSNADDGNYSYGALVGDLRAVVESVSHHGHVIVGHSWGATIAAAYAAQYPDCAGIMLVNGMLPERHEPQSDAGWQEVLAYAQGDPIESALISFIGTQDEVDKLLSWAKQTQDAFSPAVGQRLFVEGDDGHSSFTDLAANIVDGDEGMGALVGIDTDHDHADSVHSETREGQE